MIVSKDSYQNPWLFRWEKLQNQTLIGNDGKLVVGIIILKFLVISFPVWWLSSFVLS